MEVEKKTATKLLSRGKVSRGPEELETISKFSFSPFSFSGLYWDSKRSAVQELRDEKMSEAPSQLLSTSRIWAYRSFSVKRVILALRTIEVKVSCAFIEAIRIFRIMMSLHSANDFSAILRLYGIEESAHPVLNRGTT